MNGMMRSALALFLIMGPAAAAPKADLKPETIESAELPTKIADDGKLSASMVKLQVLLDRIHFSPGEIDGRAGDNVRKALQAYAQMKGFSIEKELSPELRSNLMEQANRPIVKRYTLTDGDVKGPFLQKIPAKMEEMKSLDALSYTSAREALGERFHMSEDLLAALNPGASFDKAGSAINVVDAGTNRFEAKVTRVDIDKSRETVTAFDANGAIVAFFPASVGSEEKPTPDGKLKVVSIDANPIYRYNPKYKFKGVSSTKPFTIKPGPNNPVGAVWIGLSAEGIGIHGTADPSHVSKSESHGCVRLTNWDVKRLADALKKGVEVDFTQSSPG
jgi:lipoprotein-anchoring transpeptidase ErfK/SrfK